MIDDLPPPDCPFIRTMLAILAEGPTQADRRPEEARFASLLRLEKDALNGGAPLASVRIIGQVRRMAGIHAAITPAISKSMS